MANPVIEVWLALRRKHGLHAKRQRCMTPAPDVVKGGWTKRPLTTDETTKWITLLLQRLG